LLNTGVGGRQRRQTSSGATAVATFTGITLNQVMPPARQPVG